MAMTMWTDINTGRCLNRSEFDGVRERARRVYAANSQIFEDEFDALVALGVGWPDRG